MNRLWVLLVCLLVVVTGAGAHEVRPAYLEIRQTAADTYDVLWKVPALDDKLRLGVYVRMPEGSTALSEPQGVFIDRAFLQRWTMGRSGGLTGGTIEIEGLRATAIDVLVRLQRLDGSTRLVRLTPAAPSFVVEGTPSRMQVVRSYLPLGVEHILGGFDHLLFVLALLIITRGPWRLVKTVTAFTVAHSVTLSLAALGIVHVPSAPVEAVIALSIVFVATEIVHGRQGRPGLTQRAPWLVAFAFGLLHGFGFAGALSEIGLPQLDIPLALFSFNVGVEIEIGQLLFIAAMLAMGCARTTAQATSGLSVACGVKESCTVCHRQRLGVLADPATGRVLRTGPVGAGKKSCCKIKVDVRIQVEAFAHRIDDRLSSTHSIE